MSRAQRSHPVRLRVVAGAPQCPDQSDDAGPAVADSMPSAADVDWTILMARTQLGDAVANLRLLQ